MAVRLGEFVAFILLQQTKPEFFFQRRIMNVRTRRGNGLQTF